MSRLLKILPFIALVVGFFLGRFSINKVSKVETKSISTQIVAQKLDIQTQATVQKDLTTGLKSSYTEKFYSHNGILLHEIINTHDVVSKDIAQKKYVTKLDSQSKREVQSQSQTITIYQSNLIGGIFYPASHEDFRNFKPTELSFSISYRFLDGLYLTGMSDFKFQKPQLGIQFTF